MSWKDVTIEKYMRLKSAMSEQYESEEVKAFAILSVLHDKPSEHFENIPYSELLRLIKEANFIYSPEITKGVPSLLKVNGKNYNVELDVSNLIAGQYIDLTNWCKPDVIEDNYHNILSAFLSPRTLLGGDQFKQRLKKCKTEDEYIHCHKQITKDRQKIAEELKAHLTMDRVFALASYFFLLSKNLMDATQAYMVKQMKKQTKEASQLLAKMDLESIGDGSSH